MEDSWKYGIWFALALKSCKVFTFLLLRRYSNHSQNVPFFVKVLTFIGWFLGMATIAILPLDISMAANQIDLPDMEYTLRTFWRSFYWLAFFYSFLLAPIAMNYEVSGEFNQSMRLKYAVKRVALLYGRYAVLGVIFLIWLWLHGTVSRLEVRGLLMALGSSFGLL